MYTAETATNVQSEMDVLRKMEDEYLRLKRQVRMKQTDRQNRTMGVHPLFRRQDHLLRTLKKEYINLLMDLKIARSGAHKKKDRKMKMDLKRAIYQRVNADDECEGGMTVIGQLEGLLKRNNKHLVQIRKLANANKGQLDERRFASESRLVSTENRLEAASLRFNAVQCENQKIRGEIEHMLRDRLLFNRAWDGMLGALNKGKKFLSDLFESSTLAYDQREEWVAKLRSVQEKGRMDQVLQVQEMRDLQKAYDHEMKLYKFLAAKGVVRVNRQQELKEELAKKTAEEDTRQKIEDHYRRLEEITNYTQEHNIEVIKDAFEKREQDNFSIYKLLNDHCAENVVLSRDLEMRKRDIGDRLDYNEGRVAKQEEKIMKLSQQLEEHVARRQALQKRIQEKQALLDTTMDNIGDIFRMLECSTEPFEKLLGEKCPSLRTRSLTLQLITDRIKELVEIVYYYERYVQKKTDKTASRLKKYTVHAEAKRSWSPSPISWLVAADPCPACVEARWLSRVSETSEVPFTKEMALQALSELNLDPAYVRGDRVHPITDCRVPGSRVILAARYM